MCRLYRPSNFSQMQRLECWNEIRKSAFKCWKTTFKSSPTTQTTIISSSPNLCQINIITSHDSNSNCTNPWSVWFASKLLLPRCMIKRWINVLQGEIAPTRKMKISLTHSVRITTNLKVMQEIRVGRLSILSKDFLRISRHGNLNFLPTFWLMNSPKGTTISLSLRWQIKSEC